MSYVKTNWINGTTPVNAANMNKIEDELEILDTRPTGPTEYLKKAEVTTTPHKIILTKQDDTTVEFEASNPSQYIKTAAVSADQSTLTLTKQDSTTVTFTPPSSGGGASPFPSAFNTTGTTLEFGQSVITYMESLSSAKGKIWLGSLSCTDLPNGMNNAECKVMAITDSIAQIDLYSSNVPPYHWEFNTNSVHSSYEADHEWKVSPQITNNILNKSAIVTDGSKSFYTFTKGRKQVGTESTVYSWVGGVETGNVTKWLNVTIPQSELLGVINGNTYAAEFPPVVEGGDPWEYEPTNNKDNSLKLTATVEEGSTEELGTLMHSGNVLNKIYLDFSEGKILRAKEFLQNDLANEFINQGFDYNYYKTLVLIAGVDEGSLPVYQGPIDNDNIIYVQDVSQQPWENNPDDLSSSSTSDRREQLNPDLYGLAVVLSIKGDPDVSNNSTSLLLCLKDSMAAYWDTASNATRWVDIYEGRVYPVTFDPEGALGSHNTLRWLVNVTDDERPEAIEITEEELTRLRDEGITFSSDLFSAKSFEDEELGLDTPCFGNGVDAMRPMFSYNIPFEPQESKNEIYYSKPQGISNSSFEYPMGEGYVFEESGYYYWFLTVKDTELRFIIPKSHLSHYVIERVDSGSSGSTMAFTYSPIFRHTFTVRTPNEEGTYPSSMVGKYAINFSMCAVNNQLGDSSWNYLLHSDESWRVDGFDWILPATGFVGEVTSDRTVTTWMPIVRIMAGYKYDDVAEIYRRTLFICYFDTSTGTIIGSDTRVTLDDSNAYDSDDSAYRVADFRSQIGTYLS